MTGRMCDEMDFMVWHICGIFFAFQPYFLITRIIELAKKSTIGFISGDVLIFSITYAHRAFNCHFDRMNVEPITVQTQYWNDTITSTRVKKKIEKRGNA